MPMDPPHYTVEKLMALRGSNLQLDFEKGLLEHAKDNRVLSDIMRHKLRYKRGMILSSRANVDVRKSSAESEDNVFTNAQVPQHISQLQDQNIRQNTIPSSIEAIQLDGQDAEPELGTTQALPQPPILPDQKRKGFEQFYEAVRSPTHVRVTAGGRIVPNTFDPSHSSPTGKGSKERLVGDSNGIQPPFGTPFLPGQPMMAAPMHPAMHPAFLMAQGPPGTMPPFSGQWFFPPPPLMPMGLPFPGTPMMPMGPFIYQQPPTPVSATGIGSRPFSSAIQQPESFPISSIRPSIITKNQLSGLRSSLKKAEAQLAYNRHQIDEKHMEEYARQLRADIEHFEIKLKGELALEENASQEHSTGKGSIKESSQGKGDEQLNRGKADPMESSQSNGDKPIKTHKKGKVKLTVDTSKATKPSLLPVSAALAPVFQPRSDLENASQDIGRTTTATAANPTVDNKRDTFGGKFYGPIPANFEESNRYLSSVAPPTPAEDIEAFSNFARENAGLGLPYLVGEVPFGMDPSPEIRDYIYHRALTQDEEMAKHLFWTNAPDHLRKKFPKFNGKDFFPVSPEKHIRPKSKVVNNLPTGRPEQDYGFSLPAADLDPFAPLEPYRGDTFRTAAARNRDLKRATKSDNVTSPMKPRSGSKLRPVAYFNSQGLDELKDSSRSSDNIGETESERAYFNSCVRAWSERVTATATALPGAVTSENAHGYLPQYTIGNAAASLSPVIAKAAGQASRLPHPKTNDNSNLDATLARLANSVDGRAENQPPKRSVRIK
ncbi:uncharacterized protein CTRU02_203976 [Colletotrichum truncatum]|uniref:Uncharacterized protein n=1 Tax=Colletotrichum truncatum TaxID=5467 RepID=A0ACC3ZAS8_COLTU|nr:uncharacterized protein CTRU02_15458 [Colletotrichum truncatum]KAF6781057.1 hypothetical protein CTRU02_15458 [Colletotrichum truncatum]